MGDKWNPVPNGIPVTNATFFTVGNFSVDPNTKRSFKDVEALVGSALKQGGCFYPPCKAL